MIRFIALVTFLFLTALVATTAAAQERIKRDPTVPVSGMGTHPGSTAPPQRKSADTTLRHRDGTEDSITIYYRYLDSNKLHLPDTTLNDIDLYFPLPFTSYHLGNLGNAANSYLFSPLMKPGFDAGFHAYDAYRYTIEKTKFYETTRPFTEMDYTIGSKGQQIIEITHTQNRTSNLNFGFNYRFINSFGNFRNQNSSHNNIRFNLAYQSPNKRYHFYGIFINNKLKSSENGGLVNASLLDSLKLSDPIEIPARLGNSGTTLSRNFFNTNVSTGTIYNESMLMIRNQYDFGQKDSLVKDTVIYRLFYPRFRLQHTLNYSSSTYSFEDLYAADSNYRKYFGYKGLAASDTVVFRDKWQQINNEFTLISFPERNNPNQYIKLGAGLDLIYGTLDTGSSKINYSEVYLLGEYRNLTRNKKWDINLQGRLYTAGGYAGDYAASVELQRTLGSAFGYFSLGARNINRTPSFVFDPQSAFPLTGAAIGGKENISHIFSSVYLSALKLKLSGDYYLLANYAYFDSFYHAAQSSALFHVLKVGAEKRVRLLKNVNWYIEAFVQQTTANAPVNLPFFFTRNRVVWGGKAFKNLRWATGFEVRYHTAYKAAGYSPLTGQFIYQDHWTARNRPDVHYFLHFQITKFRGFIRLQNLNTFTLSGNKSGFKERNFRAEYYPDEALWLRVGIFWKFIN